MRATPAVMPVVGFPLLLCHRSLFVGKLSLWGRLSSRPWSRLPAASAQPNAVGAHQCVRPPWSAPPALPHRMFAWSMPPGLPCRRSRRQSHTIPSCTGVPIANRRQNWRRGTHDCALHLNPPLPLPSPCPPCSLWFAFLRVLRVLCGLLFPCPPHPQSQPSPNLFSFPFQPLPNSPFLLLLLLSCMLKVKGAADALVGARTADGASPGPQRRRPQPLPSPDGGELRSLKPAAGGEQAGGGLLT